MDLPKDWGLWLSGFIDAEGSFAITQANGGFRCSFQIHLRNDDLAVLALLRRLTGIGGIFKSTSRSCAWQIGNKADCQKLQALLHRYPLRAKKARAFDIWSTAVDEWSHIRRSNRGVNNWAAMGRCKDALIQAHAYTPGLEISRSPDEGFWKWLGGFIDGEGCFSISHRKSGSYSCLFSLRVRDDDRSIIEEIRDRTNLGSVYTSPSRRPRSNPQVGWVVSAKPEILTLSRLFKEKDMALMAKKSFDLEIWQDAVAHWQTLSRPFDWTHMAQYRRDLDAIREYRSYSLA